MRRCLLILFLASTALAQSPGVPEKLRDAQKSFAAGDCPRAQAMLHEVIAADPKNYVAHLLSAHCLLREKDYTGAAAEFRHAMEIRPGTAPAELGLIQTYVLAGDKVHRDAEIEHLLALINAGKIPNTTRFVRDQITAADKQVIVNEYPYLTALRTRYAFEVFDPQQKLVRTFELVSRESDQPHQAAAGARRFSLISTTNAQETVVRVYDRGEPAYEQVVADVTKSLSRRRLSSIKYALAANPAVVVPIPISVEDTSDPRLQLQRGQVAIEYIAHSCFRIHTASTRLLIDPFASRMWIGYDFPAQLPAAAVLITHPHYDHDADVLLGHQPPPWTPDVRVLRDPGAYKVGDVAITGIRGKHADPWGKEFGQTNTIWLLEVDGLRIVHLGDNGPLTDQNIKQLGRVDILMMPIDAEHHILEDAEIDAIRNALRPKIVIPMHYRIPDLEPSPASPEGLGEIGPWVAGQKNVVQLTSNVATFIGGTFLPAQLIVVFPHSAKVSLHGSR